jgi:hypothetical protein
MFPLRSSGLEALTSLPVYFPAYLTGVVSNVRANVLLSHTRVVR